MMSRFSITMCMQHFYTSQKAALTPAVEPRCEEQNIRKRAELFGQGRGHLARRSVHSLPPTHMLHDARAIFNATLSYIRV